MGGLGCFIEFDSMGRRRLFRVITIVIFVDFEVRHKNLERRLVSIKNF